jgi:hypothetical protein
MAKTSDNKRCSKNSKKKKKAKTLAQKADRHVLYQDSVQCVEAEIDFVDDTFRKNGFADAKATVQSVLISIRRFSSGGRKTTSNLWAMRPTRSRCTKKMSSMCAMSRSIPFLR